MAEVPNDPVSELHTAVGENAVEENIQWKHFSIFYKIPDLPADAPTVFENSDEFIRKQSLFLQVESESSLLLIFLAQVVWGRRDDQ